MKKLSKFYSQIGVGLFLIGLLLLSGYISNFKPISNSYAAITGTVGVQTATNNVGECTPGDASADSAEDLGCDQGGSNATNTTTGFSSSSNTSSVTVTVFPPVSATISATNCEIVTNASTCVSKVTWKVSNWVEGDVEVTRNNPSNTSVSKLLSGTNVSNTVNYGPSTYYVYYDYENNKNPLAEAPIKATCVAGTDWDKTEKKCITSTTPVSATISATNCEIVTNASTCVSKVTWKVSNWVEGAVEVTRDNPSNTSVSKLLSGTNVSNAVNYGPSTYYVYYDYENNKNPLAEAPIKATCVDGNSWIGGKCIVTPTCSDGIKNQNETGIDTGGVCAGTSCSEPLTKIITDIVCDPKDGVAAISGSVTRSQKKVAPSCTFGLPVTVDNSTYISDNCKYSTGGKTDGYWSDWQPSLSVCPLSPITQTSTYTAARNGGIDSPVGTKDGAIKTQTINPDDCPTVDIEVSPAGKIKYNGKVNINWKSTKAASCSCAWKDISNKEGTCGGGSPDPTTPYTSPALKKTITYTVTCNSSSGITASDSVKVLVDDINTNYKEN